ncbi:hypothetical protein [Novosphingobium sp. EMRT-2]|nr:hypothetical protein [Novosphingobium sp. EMRT-2]
MGRTGSATYFCSDGVDERAIVTMVDGLGLGAAFWGSVFLALTIPLAF